MRADLIAGITLAACALPVSIAYATPAGLPPQAGILGFNWADSPTLCPALAANWPSGQRRPYPRSMLAGVTIAPSAKGDSARWATIASQTAAPTATIYCAGSETISLGFKAGDAIMLAVSQLPKLLGVRRLATVRR